MVRYSVINTKNKREIVLLKGFPCKWGKCSYCDYILDNDTNLNSMIKENREVLANVVNRYGVLEVLNSGSIFELPQETLQDIKDLVQAKGIKELLVESYWSYKSKLDEMKKFFGIPIVFRFGVETFDNDFRNNVLKKGTKNLSVDEIARYFNAVYLLVGVKGQTREMIQRDVEILLAYFEYGRINIFVKNSTQIEQNLEIIDWFRSEYEYLQTLDNIDIIWNNTDLGVG